MAKAFFYARFVAIPYILSASPTSPKPRERHFRSLSFSKRKFSTRASMLFGARSKKVTTPFCSWVPRAWGQRLSDSATELANKGSSKKPVPSVHIVFADQDGLVTQLEKDMASLPTDSPYLVYRWGGQKEADGTPLTIDGIVDKAQQSGH